MFTKFKIPAMVCLTIVAGVTLAIAGTGANKWYPTNQAPLKQTKYVLLPVATVKPAGWLHKELSLWANGLTGHLYELDAGSQDDIARFVKNSKWRSDAYSGDRWEAGPYYLNGLMPLAYLLDDARLIAECQTWANNMLKHRTDWFANVSGDDMWASSIAWQCLRSWFEARGERPEDTAAFYALTRNYFNLINTGNWGSNTWAWTRGGENFLALQWFHRRTGASNIPSIAQSVKSKVCDWTPIYNTMRSGNNDLRNPQGWYMQGHVVNHGMAIKFGSAYWPFATATAADSQAGVTAYEKMLKYHGHILGAFTGDESLAGLKAWHGLETCGCVETMYSLENMIEMFGKVEWADNLEYLAYNNLPGRYTPDGWNRQYHSQVNQVSISSAPRSWMSSNVDANIYGNFNTLFRCCTVNMHQGWPKFVVNSWMATQDNGLVAPVYGPTTITAKVGSGATPATVTINETTEYPFKNIVTFTIGATSAPTAFPLVVRVPLWGKGTSIVAAGATIAGSGSPTNLDAGQWVTISKTWNTGDQVTVTLPFTIRA
ncbi:MAG: glycoside hydrolase family 127 protein, partial [Chitinispirillaceae bacterium]|nr:glycoside hydrolase family 127 protein [Chitinispirillaceae bacterium]